MNHNPCKNERSRRGAIVVLGSIMVVVLLGILAFAVDYGHLLKVRTDLQRAADAAALAAVQDLIRKPDGTQDVNKARETVVTYARNNMNNASLQVASDDIQIGRYNPDTIYSGVTLLNTGTFDTVRVTLRRDGATNPAVPLFFARMFGMQEATVTATATAVLQKAQLMQPGAEVLPFATPQPLWDSLAPGDMWIAYGDGRLSSNGATVPGNWGTLDIGSTDNSTSSLNDQISNGLRESDIDALHSSGRIPQNGHIDSSQPTWMQGDPGLSSGLKQSVENVHGSIKIIPIYDQLGGQWGGNNVEFHVVGWGVVTVIDSQWSGSNNTYVKVRKSHQLNGKLRPKGSLSAEEGYIDGAYTSPALVE